VNAIEEWIASNADLKLDDLPAPGDCDRGPAMDEAPAPGDCDRGPATSVLLATPDWIGGWRTEVTRRGRYWQWRRGSGTARQSAYGGKFAGLPLERKVAYEANKAKAQGAARA